MIPLHRLCPMLYVSYIHLSHTLTIFKFITCAYWVSSAWHEADPHYADLVSVGIGSQPHSPPPPLPPFQMPSRGVKHLIFQSLVLPVSIPFSSIPGAYLYDLPTSTSGFPWWLSSKEPAYQCRRCGFNSWVRKMPWRKKRQPTPVFLLGKSHGQRNLVGYSPWVCKESDMTEHLSIHECTASYIKTGIFWPTQHMQRKRKHFLKISPLKNEIFINDEDKNSQNQKLWIKGFS